MSKQNKYSGFVLMELLTGFMILIFLLAAFLFLLMTLNKNLTQTQKKMQQTQAVKNQMEILKTKSFDSLVSDPALGLAVKFLKPDLKEAVLTTLNGQWVFRLAR
jgi:type II secretory pathway pseudopilin PulG